MTKFNKTWRDKQVSPPTTAKREKYNQWKDWEHFTSPEQKYMEEMLTPGAPIKVFSIVAGVLAASAGLVLLFL